MDLLATCSFNQKGPTEIQGKFTFVHPSCVQVRLRSGLWPGWRRWPRAQRGCSCMCTCTNKLAIAMAYHKCQKAAFTAHASFAAQLSPPNEWRHWQQWEFKAPFVYFSLFPSCMCQKLNRKHISQMNRIVLGCWEFMRGTTQINKCKCEF